MVARYVAFTEDLFERILDGIREGHSVRSVLDADPENMPSRGAFFRWLAESSALQDRYMRAKQIGLEVVAEDMFDIADDGSNDYMTIRGKRVPDPETAARSKLRVETRKWVLSKLKPKVYGDKLDVEHGGQVVVKITNEDADL